MSALILSTLESQRQLLLTQWAVPSAHSIALQSESLLHGKNTDPSALDTTENDMTANICTVALAAILICNKLYLILMMSKESHLMKKAFSIFLIFPLLETR
jgi:hypothetical protein